MFREDIDDSSVNTSMPLQAQPVSPVAAQFGAGDVGIQALGPTIAFTSLATLIVALRWYTRACLVRRVGKDDYVILISMVISWAMCTIIGVSIGEGVGHYEGHMDLQAIAKLIVAFNTLWSILVNITKASILAQYLRIFDGTWTRRSCYFILFLLLPATAWGIFGGIFLCRPTAKIWNPQIPGNCRNAQTYWSSVSAVDIFLDFWTLILPMPSIAGLHLPRKQKIATMLAFLLGFVVCIVGVARMATVLASSEQGNYILSGVWAIIWSSVEGNISIICASILSLKALVTRMFPRLLEQTGSAKHAMRLPNVSGAGGEWEKGDSQAMTLGNSGSSLLHPSKLGVVQGKDQAAMCRAPPACMPPTSVSRRSRHKPADSQSDAIDIFQMLQADAQDQDDGKSEASST
ncbi:Satratoxin biosynthesis SC1 cluster protein 4 [Pseudocercospora fuligena]|uniref:Satratoxin biosynthesis SC1 cluster protein 4 n=1 Tax=Pseudocercospora fuligena TaxID=685502 RepID=A0A8H6RJQ3_9PEZI|nr:Satratoxin biosynthesis SC1 cluster protein 4 [Pseudocercospora fuligena]